jgi:anti-sigma factor RsiW
MSCESVRRCLSAWVDGESVPLDPASISEHLATCEACRAEEKRLRDFRSTLRRAFVVEPAPAGLRRRIVARAVLARHRVAFAAVAIAAAAVLIGWVAIPRTSGSYELEAVAAHEALIDSRLPLDFAETDPQRLAAALRDRLAFDLQLPGLATSGLKLLGARLAQLQGRDAALVQFDDRGRRVTLAVQARRGPPAAGPPTFRNRRVGAYDIVSWEHGALSYSLVSDSANAARSGCAACHVTPL